jgi:hypothetical protein
MNTKSISLFLVMIWILAACQPGSALSPARATVNQEITLAPDQSAAVTGADLTITFHSVLRDERCPRDIECVTSGPVAVSLSVQQGDGTPDDFALQTFTDPNGRSPNVQFEGITNRAEVGDYIIQIASVIPYPRNSATEIKASEYRVTLLVSSR